MALAPTHLAPETLLLYGLGHPLGDGGTGRARETAVRAHLVDCGGCRDRLDATLEARFGGGEESAEGAGHRPVAAAAATAKSFEAPEPPQLLGQIKLADGSPIAVFQRPDAPGTFAFDRLDLARKSIRFVGAGGRPAGIAGAVDRFGRLRLAAADAKRLAALLHEGAPLTIEVT